ncbi:protein of unknown function [Vibrio tapetis subsp. tapetis]|uniref:Uncharacterized protein n=1 Tax=Vibrio tapetis subsp. tapetis TaxID=1671868 RepID=A0A2N8ZBV6_9VIBR|nr:protein of unknown function [Vibrio tapetis subsp. tapetis]
MANLMKPQKLVNYFIKLNVIINLSNYNHDVSELNVLFNGDNNEVFSSYITWVNSINQYVSRYV